MLLYSIMLAGDIMERLQKVIANSGITSRRKAEDLIINGKVKVNGKVVTTLGIKVGNKDRIEVNNSLLKKEEKEYYLLYKPRGVICSSSDDKDRKTVIELINTNKRIYPVGRLDYDTTGVLVLTNDGEFANILMHPKESIEKVYIAKIKGIIKKEGILALRDGVIIDGIKTKPAKVKLKSYNKKNNTSILQVIIHEGKNHQVKNMFKVLGYEVIKLKREREAIFTLDNLKTGDYRRLTPKEVAIIYNLK